MPVQVIIVGGFLGAGKTTLLMEAARQLTDQGYRVGLVTNDQGKNLVDTALLRTQDYPVTEVSGGCFCCNFPDLVQALTLLQEQAQPDIILAEPVGSCTDLVATTLRPLMTYYPEQFRIAPLSVLVDPRRDLSVFPADVEYLFSKQLAEAEFILLNKSDLLDRDARQSFLDAISAGHTTARTLAISALSGEGVAAWLDQCLGRVSSAPHTMDLDYARYADAEAALGWLNAAGKVRANSSFSALEWTAGLLDKLAHACRDQQLTIAHIKAQSQSGDRVYKASITDTGVPLSWSLRPADLASTEIEFILNARVNSHPSVLEKIVMDTIESMRPDSGSRYYFTHFECFSPLPPKPTYRLAQGAQSG